MEAVKVVSEGSVKEKFKFEFDEGDGTSDWSFLKRDMAEARATNYSRKFILVKLFKVLAGSTVSIL